MKTIVDIDPNFQTACTVKEPDVCWREAAEAPFRLYGHAEPYIRMPAAAADRVSESVSVLSRNTAGMRVRFTTDSEYVALRCRYPLQCDFSHMPRTGTSGFDLYLDTDAGSIFRRCFVPPWDGKFSREGYESIIHLGSREMRSMTVYFPLYNDITSLEIGLQQDAATLDPKPYVSDKPVIFYGSSITHGGCASRPGMNYPSILCRRLNRDFINLGFSGSCCGEQPMAEYLATLPMDLLVLGYDYNAPNPRFLRDTHRPFYETFRRLRPDAKILFVSHPTFSMNDPIEARHQAVIDTYRCAKASGDEKVWFVDGRTLFGNHPSDGCTVDGVHPNDVGMERMADTLEPVLRTLLG